MAAFDEQNRQSELQLEKGSCEPMLVCWAAGPGTPGAPFLAAFADAQSSCGTFAAIL
jgi:hypothetical protein